MIDASIALEAGKGTSPFSDAAKTPNYLADPTKLNALMTMMGKNAAGKALQASIGPDGGVDFNKFNSLIAQDPTIASYALEAMNQGLDASAKQIEQQTKQRREGLAALVPLLSSPNMQSQDTAKEAQKELFGMVTNLHNQGSIDARTAASLTGMIPRMPNGELNVDQTRQALFQGSLQLMDPAQRQAAASGELVWINNGKEQIPFRVNKATGAYEQAGKPVPLYATPGEMAGRVPVEPTPEGKPQTAPMGTVTPPELGGMGALPTQGIQGGGPGAPPPMGSSAKPSPMGSAKPNSPPQVGTGTIGLDPETRSALGKIMAAKTATAARAAFSALPPEKQKVVEEWLSRYAKSK